MNVLSCLIIINTGSVGSVVFLIEKCNAVDQQAAKGERSEEETVKFDNDNEFDLLPDTNELYIHSTWPILQILCTREPAELQPRVSLDLDSRCVPGNLPAMSGYQI